MPRIVLAFVISLFQLAMPAHAETNPPTIETSQTFGNRIVYYNVFPSTDLLPEVAARYQLTRANDRVVLNISLRDTKLENLSQAATVTGTYSDLIEAKKLEFREVREPGAVYYIAELRVMNREVLRFDVTVLPQEAGGDAPAPPLTLTFTRKFAVDK
jgi:hypothetical protein